jgi:hypothetical protein
VKEFNQKLQVQFEFGFGLMIFDIVSLLNLEKNKKFQFLLAFVGMYVPG